jgi:hypothetical protein
MTGKADDLNLIRRRGLIEIPFHDVLLDCSPFTSGFVLSKIFAKMLLMDKVRIS